MSDDRPYARALLAEAASGDVEMHLSVEAIQEFVHHRMRRGSLAAVQEASQLRDLSVAHAFDDGVLNEALELIATTSLRGRDAVHAATALRAGFDTIVSGDRDFDVIPGLTRVLLSSWR